MAKILYIEDILDNAALAERLLTGRGHGQMNRLYFVRHGEGQDNVAERFSCKRVDNSLTEQGVLQAQQTAEFLAKKPIDEVYSSPMKRALETAQVIAARLGKGLTVLENFREVNVGELEGQPFSEENWRLYHRVTGAWFDGQPQVAFPGGETYTAMWERWQSGLAQILVGKEGRDILLVGHSGIFTVVLKDLCPELEVGWLKNAACYNCSITELEIALDADKPRGRLVAWAAHGHLRGKAQRLVPGIPPLESFEDPQGSRQD